MNKARFHFNVALGLSLLAASTVGMNVVAQAQVVRANYQTQKANYQAQKADPKAVKKELSEDRLRVYSDFLKIWRTADIPVLNIAMDLDTVEGSGPDAEDGCSKSFTAESMPKEPVRQFSVSDANKLGQGYVSLVDRYAQLKDVEKFDPSNTIQRGESVDAAVRNGFSHGVFSFSEIQFDKTHEHATLTYSFYCGKECGTGATVVLTKTDLGYWTISSRCHQWIG
jgi:hypothetical protein